jgi:hypothetical protein
MRKKEFTLFKIRGEDNPADLMTKHLPSDKMIKCLGFMGATFREGRAAIAPLRKEHERLTGEDLDWQLAETARNELDDGEVEMRLMAELGDSVEHAELKREEIMSTGECSGGVTDPARRMRVRVPAAGVAGDVLVALSFCVVASPPRARHGLGTQQPATHATTSPMATTAVATGAAQPCCSAIARHRPDPDPHP